MNPQTLQMLMALQGNQQQGMGVAPGMQQGMANAMPPQSPMNQMPGMGPSTAPLANGQNASLGGGTGASLGTPQDQMLQAMFGGTPGQ